MKTLYGYSDAIEARQDKVQKAIDEANDDISRFSDLFDGLDTSSSMLDVIEWYAINIVGIPEEQLTKPIALWTEEDDEVFGKLQDEITVFTRN